MKPIEIAGGHLETIRSVLKAHVPDFEVWAFGSRVNGTAKKHSDLDLALISDSPLALKRRAALRETFSESSLPFKVDIIEWRNTSEEFRKIIKKRYVVLQTPAQK